MMRSSPARSFVLVLDCCSSGGWKSATDLLPDPSTGTGRFLITSSRAGQNSKDAAVVTESSPFTKYLVEAIADADVDIDDDGFVDIDEIYKYVERSLKDSGQEAQRDFDKSKGTRRTGPTTDREGRGRRPNPNPTHDIGPEEPTSLSVVPERIEVAGVRPDDLPVVERIYVYNRGGGVLDWTADSDDAWISLEPLDDYVRVSLAPTAAGSSRGTRLRARAGRRRAAGPGPDRARGGQEAWSSRRSERSLLAAGWTRAKTMVAAAVALVVVVAVAIAAIVDPTPPGPGPGGGDGDGEGDGIPPTEMVFEWRAEPIDGVGAPPEVINGVTSCGGTPRRGGCPRFEGGHVGGSVTVSGRRSRLPSDAPEGQVINGLSPFKGRFLAVGGIEGSDGRDAAAWWVSLDGALTPTGTFDLPGDQTINKGFPLPGEGILGVGQNGGDGAVWFSEDGDNWILQRPAGELGGPGRQALLRAGRFEPVGGGAEMLVAVGYEERGSDEDGAVWIAEDRSSWRRVRSDASGGTGISGSST